MKFVLGLLVAVVALCGVAFAELLTPYEFTVEFMRALAEALPAAKVSSDRSLQLTVRHRDGRESTIELANPYRDYSQDPKRLDQLVRSFANAIGGAREAAPLDRARIVPVIKDKQWITDVEKTLAARGTPQETAYESFNNELIIVYAEDDPTRTRYLAKQEVASIDRQELRSLAIANLKRIMPKIQAEVDGGLYLVSAGGDYEASLLLIDEIWSGGQFQVNGDIVVAVPARDALLVTGSRERAALRRMREAATKLAAQGPHGLTDTLFVYRNGRFSKFGR
jgi:uncharacterized protein YtpQ (UPF0354 family)